MKFEKDLKKNTKTLSPIILPSVTLSEFLALDKDGKISLEEIIHTFKENGISLTMIFFALPVAIPLPWPPGFTSLLGIPLLIFSIQMVLRFPKLRLPEKINKFKMKNSTLMMLSEKSIPILKFFESYLKSRFNFADSIYCAQFIGLISLIASIAISFPVPLTNSIPAWGVVIMNLGLLKRDGLVIIVGFVVSIVGILIASIMLIGVLVGIKKIIGVL